MFYGLFSHTNNVASSRLSYKFKNYLRMQSCLHEDKKKHRNVIINLQSLRQKNE